MTKKFLALIVSLTFMLNVPVIYADEAESQKAEPQGPEVLMIADFESGDETNNMGGGTGSWNMDPTDINNSYCDPDIVEIPDADGNANRAIRLSYSTESDLPSQNGWWTKLDNLDASSYDVLKMDVKGDAERGYTTKFKIQIKKFKPAREGEDEEYTEEKIKSSYEIPVSAEWETIEIPLNRLTGLIDFANPEAWQNPSIARRNLDEFVVVFQDRHVSEKIGTVYLDNIQFVRTGEGGPTAVDFPQQTREKTEEVLEGLDFAKYLISRLGGFPTETVVKKRFPENDREFIREIAHDTWKFFDNIVDQEHGLVLDTVKVGDNVGVDEGTWIGDYTNVTNIGVYFMAVVSAYDLGFITRQSAVARLQKTMNTLEKLEYHVSGFPFNYYDTTLASRTSYFVSLVDSGWLVAGLYVAKNAFPEELGDQAQSLIDRGDLVFFYDPVERQMYHGFYEHLKVYSDYHYGVFYTEPRASSYLAVASGQVPDEHWFSGMIRTFPPEYGWQAQEPINRVEKTTLGHKYYGGYYQWKDLKYVPSWGGSAFEALMPTLVLKEKELAPEGLGANNHAHVQGQIRFAMEELGYPVWGMSPSTVPEGGYSEFGAKPFGSKGYKPGVVTPHASVLAIEYAPKEVVANLRKMIELYDIYGEYGFYDAVRVETGLVMRKYLSLDQGMILVAINNYLNDGSIRNYFHSDPKMKNGEKLLSAEKLFE